MNSTAPAAPSMCPVIDLVELTFTLVRVLAEHRLDGLRLGEVVRGVDVPCALM